MTDVILRNENLRRVLSGHPWIYKTEIDHIEGDYEPGGIVDVYDYKKNFIGRGYINLKSMITVRLLTHEKDELINEDFFKKRILKAWEYRKKVMDNLNSCRVIFGEADFLPALIVDKFGDYLVIQTLSLGMERYKGLIVNILVELLRPKGIYERNDVSVRMLEGLPETKGFLYGNFDTIQQFEENGVKLLVDIENGQKTGYFLDQKENRAAIKKYVKDADVLDCFSHTGSFSVHALHYGAKSVETVDISETALDMAKKNVALNGYLDKCHFTCENAFDLLKKYDEENKRFDVVILDPPAFTKSKETVKDAIRGYKEINLRAMKILKRGGFLITCSCSQHISPDAFLNIIKEAAHDTRKNTRLIEKRTQSKDHPILLSSSETEYLKCLILQVF
ncbi:rRNA large subunit methyltransferase I [Thermoanaerobacterium sp. PSU-2]|uniref:class I SAM-dependent rRNA methyltransferase n=1 Tax=Thermoanaerobacterium sp. PSU-2 TaxID=1930849 RepID=UPI000A15956C|nr:class I SAM-dependent rRNA methyltransferase [Thermoanaerobacterium sp. PSU-2]ORX23894.1 rRNA large subunit methyltransferase I [Thermoanaerobacterium sp. PSU-2]HHV73544.1 class I SAM-dependent rRNA methyltransferase [Thermoanaerobacterium sp.]